MFLDSVPFLIKLLKWLFCAPPKGGIIMFWMLLSQALTIPNPVTCSGSLLNFKKFQRDEARGNVGCCRWGKQRRPMALSEGSSLWGKGCLGSWGTLRALHAVLWTLSVDIAALKVPDQRHWLRCPGKTPEITWNDRKIQGRQKLPECLGCTMWDLSLGPEKGVWGRDLILRTNS